MSRLLRAWRALRVPGAQQAVVPTRAPVRPLNVEELVAAGGACAPQELAVGDSLGWLNAALEGLWPKTNAAVQKLVHEQVTQQLQDQLPAMFGDIHFSEFTLGTVPPALGPVRVYDMNGGIKVTIGIDLQSDADISVQVGPVSLGVRALRFSGQLVVRLEQLLDQLPVVGGIVIYFLDPPKIDFTLTGLGVGAEFPGLRGLLRRSLDRVVSSSLVLPNQVAIPLGNEAQGVDRAELMLAKPMGLLRVANLQAAALQSPDWEEASKETADAYVVVKTADQRWESSTIQGSRDPVWPEDEFGDLLIYDLEQRVWASVFDHDHDETCDFVGASKDLSVGDALGNSDALVLHPTVHAATEDAQEEDPRGEVSMSFNLLEFVPAELCGDRFVVCVKVSALSLPARFGGRARLVASLSSGQTKETPLGREAVRHEGSLAISELLRDVVQRADARGLSPEDIAEITALSEEDVAAVLGGGEVAEETVLAKTRRLVRVDACLFFPFSPGLLSADGDEPSDEDAELEGRGDLKLAVLDRAGRQLASASVPLSSIADADHLTLTELVAMPLAEAVDEGDADEIIEAHVSLSLMGTRMVESCVE